MKPITSCAVKPYLYIKYAVLFSMLLMPRHVKAEPTSNEHTSPAKTSFAVHGNFDSSLFNRILGQPDEGLDDVVGGACAVVKVYVDVIYAFLGKVSSIVAGTPSAPCPHHTG